MCNPKVKDLSRLGRHRTQTALFIEYLREHNVRVLSATESIDTFNENDDLIIGFKGLVNDFYARDGSRRVRTGYRQKQKEGLVAIPPFGYFKDKNTKKVVIVEEAAETVRLIYTEYVGGRGLKAIARILNEQKRKTPVQMQLELLNKKQPSTYDGIKKKHIWDATMVSRILQDESYIGTLICHKSDTNKINKTFRFTEPEEQFRHEDFFPVIIEKEEWEQVQKLLKIQARPANGNQAKHRYAGLLSCRECGNVFIPMIRYWNGKRRVEYVCRGYHRNGKSYCTSHRIHEDVLDAAVQSYVETMREQYTVELKQLAKMQNMWALRKPILDAHILSLQEKVQGMEQEIDAIVMEKIICQV